MRSVRGSCELRPEVLQAQNTALGTELLLAALIGASPSTLRAWDRAGKTPAHSPMDAGLVEAASAKADNIGAPLVSRSHPSSADMTAL